MCLEGEDSGEDDGDEFSVASPGRLSSSFRCSGIVAVACLVVVLGRRRRGKDRRERKRRDFFKDLSFTRGWGGMDSVVTADPSGNFPESLSSRESYESAARLAAVLPLCNEGWLCAILSSNLRFLSFRMDNRLAVVVDDVAAAIPFVDSIVSSRHLWQRKQQRHGVPFGIVSLVKRKQNCAEDAPHLVWRWLPSCFR